MLRLGRSLAAALIVLLLAVARAPSAPPAAAPRLVAVADIHGDFDAFSAILAKAGLIDAGGRWAGGNATLVQTGDYTDRGSKDRQVMDLLMALEQQAPKTKGRAVVLLGNHEVMNMLGDLRYVSRETYAGFAGPDAEKRRQAGYETQAAIEKARARAAKQDPPADTPEARTRWLEAHPVGFVEQREALGPDGKYGRWLRNHGAVAEIDGTVFLHGGISPQLSGLSVKEINRRVQHEIQTFDAARRLLVDQKLVAPFATLDEIVAASRAELERLKAGPGDEERARLLDAVGGSGSWMSIHPDGPLWFRGFAEWSDSDGEGKVAPLLQALGAKRFVVGHTPQRDGRIRARFGGAVILIDTGMLSSYYAGGRASALEIEGGKLTAIYPDGRVALSAAAAQ